MAHIYFKGRLEGNGRSIQISSDPLSSTGTQTPQFSSVEGGRVSEVECHYDYGSNSDLILGTGYFVSAFVNKNCSINGNIFPTTCTNSDPQACQVQCDTN